MLNKKNYEAIAKIIRDSTRTIETSGGDMVQIINRPAIIRAFSTYFENDNKRFDEGLFVMACFVKTKIRKLCSENEHSDK